MRLEQFIQGDDSVQQHIASERAALLVAVSPMARKAIEKEILPQIEEMVTSVEVVGELCEEIKKDIQTAFKGKTEIYTRLIQYKSIDQSDDQFLDDLIHVMDEWATKTKNVLQGDGPAEPGEVKVKIEVESDINVRTETDGAAQVSVKDSEPVKEEIEVKDTSSGEKLPISVADIFVLGDVRL